ncbi:LOW QUALITY PROTEIN: hypothetical protein HID58_044668 [Brassica napus]|uniref:ADP-ribosyl cyclase/cyclic ADP-ribose hydrolase n=2 Tax=Brassica napus TaxID=3708 RepID=A0ABQ8BK14_BRANA|nr:LOW QUALITY PROTEIN: hypothetical protein HID58_044668 [Brassica napus]
MDLYLLLVIVATLLCSRIFSFVYAKDNEAKMIEDVATDVAKKLFNSTPSRDFDEFIGMEAHMNKISRVLRTYLDEVRMIGIWGPAGIGKTTIARCMFNQLSHTFQHSVFLMNVKAMCTPPVCSDDYNSPEDGFENLVWEVTRLAGKLPLGLRVMGSHFRGMSKQEWENELPELWRCLDGEIESILMFGYNALSQENKDFGNVIGIMFSGGDVNVSERAFEGMSNLQFLRLEVERAGGGDEFHLFGGASYLSRKLRLLEWKYFPMTCLDCIPNPELLVELIMHDSELEKMWEGTKPLSNLKWVDLRYSENLKDVSSLSTATSLEELSLSGCSSLVELPSSIGNAIHLKMLDLSGCSSLVELPSSIGNAIHLKKLDLSGCVSLVKLPSSIGNAVHLKKLYLSKCSSLVKLPSSIGNAIRNFEELDFSDCSSLVGVPSSIGNATNLKRLDFSRCSNLVMSNTEIQEISPWIKRSSRLFGLVVNGCKELLSLPQLPSSLSDLHAEDCESLEKLDCSFLNQKIDLNFANCFKLNKEAIDVIIKSSTYYVTILPGKEMPNYFNYQANGGSLVMKLNERPSPSSMRWKACILLVSKDEDEAGIGEMVNVHHGIKQNSLDVSCIPRNHTLYRPLTEHLYIFEFEADVTSDELCFEFRVVNKEEWMIKECGMHYESSGEVNNNQKRRREHNLSSSTPGATTIVLPFAKKDNEAKMVEDVATEVAKKLFNSTPSRDFDEFIGMEAHMNKISRVLRTDLDEVRMIGIWGPAGIGKTTIARCLFNQLSDTFQYSVFMMNVKTMYTPPVCSDDYTSPEDGFEMLVWQVTRLAGRLPLGLRVMGSYFRGMSKEEWENTLPGLRMCLDGEIESILMFSYNALSHENKDLFLHIACFFNYGWIEKVVEHLSKRFSDVRQQLNVLAEKSLIFLEIGRVSMHDMLVQLGGNIVRKQPTEPGQRQFLVDKREICEVLADGSAGSRSVIGIKFYGNKINVSERAFEGMSNLQFLRIRQERDGEGDTFHLFGGPSYLSRQLRLLDWKYFPMTCLHCIPNPELLVELIMFCSKLEKLWEGTKLLSNLKWVRLRDSKNLKDVSSLSTATSLQELDLTGCSSLVKLPYSIGNATNLQFLSLRSCSSLVELPSSIGNAIRNLEVLDFFDCSSLEEVPSSIGNATNLKHLNFSRCSSLVELPASIGNLHKLESLNLKKCCKLEISTNIEYLDLTGTAIKQVPSSIRLWPHLFMSNTEIQEISPWIKRISRLRRLVLNGCKELLSLPQLPISLSELDAEDCESLERLDCSFLNQKIALNFANCFKLNKEARDIIIQTSTSYKGTVLPGKEMPNYFNYQANGGSLVMKLNERPSPSSVRWRACILLDCKDEVEAAKGQMLFVRQWIKQNSLDDVPCSPIMHILYRPLREHLYIFEFEANVTSNKLFFEFGVIRDTWMIKECGVHYLNTDLEPDVLMSQLDSLKVSFAKLKKHGFDVSAPLTRINELLALKDRQQKAIKEKNGLDKEFRVQENKIIAYSSSSPSPPSPKSTLPRNCIHDVFPSFHGKDVRKSFLSHLLKECGIKGINLFIDNEITRGEFIGPELKKAIQGSRIAIVLLSKRYASSSWCLDELVEIMKCKEDLGQTVMPVFCEVDPTDVKKQAGEFGKVFKETCKGKTNEVTRKWSEALAKVATLAGYHSKNWDNDAKMIEDIAIDVANKLFNSSPSRDFDELIGMEAHMEKISRVLRTDLDEVRMIGIWGPAGIGKTTIARCLFNQLSHTFQYSVFLMNVKAMCTPPVCSDDYNVKLLLQQKFLSQLLNQKEDLKISHLGVAQERLNDKKVLVVLDNVDRTTRSHGQKNWVSPEDGFENLVWEVTRLVGKLPLGLRVMGSHFREMSKQEWENELPELWRCLDGEIESILMFGYNALSQENKDLFLHIACFFNAEWKEKVAEHLSTRFSNMRKRLNVLAEKSLISLESGVVSMHDLLVQLGRDIVRKQSSEPGQRRFLVDKRENCEVLADDAAGSGNVIGITFFYRGEINVSERAFEGMSNLQFLRFRVERDGGGDALHLFGGASYLSRKLRLLDWSKFPMTCLHCIPNPELLVELIMVCSKLEKLWEGTKPLTNLKWVNLSDSKNLKDVSSLSTATSLEELNLSGCSSLVELPSSIGNAIHLKKLDLSGCSSLVELPSSIGNAIHLKKLHLSGCSSLVELPSSIGNATNLQFLSLNRCSTLVELPSSLGNAIGNLEELDFSDCSSLVRVPSSIGNATNLQELDFSRCSSLVELPASIGNLHVLHMSYNENLKEFPHVLDIMTDLVMSNTEIQEIPPWINRISRLHRLVLSGCKELLSLPHLPSSLSELDAEYCESLERLDCSFLNQKIDLNFANCFKLNKEARDVIIQTSTYQFSILPGKEMPNYFNYQANGGSLVMTFNERPFPSPMICKACILLVRKDEVEAGIGQIVYVNHGIKQNSLDVPCNPSYHTLDRLLSEHLYIFEFEADVTSDELCFEFEIDCYDWMIKECGVHYLNTS